MLKKNHPSPTPLEALSFNSNLLFSNFQKNFYLTVFISEPLKLEMFSLLLWVLKMALSFQLIWRWTKPFLKPTKPRCKQEYCFLFARKSVVIAFTISQCFIVFIRIFFVTFKYYFSNYIRHRLNIKAIIKSQLANKKQYTCPKQEPYLQLDKFALFL